MPKARDSEADAEKNRPFEAKQERRREDIDSALDRHAGQHQQGTGGEPRVEHLAQDNRRGPVGEQDL